MWVSVCVVLNVVCLFVLAFKATMEIPLNYFKGEQIFFNFFIF